MSLPDAIGGYFGLELHPGFCYHKDLMALNSGRNAFEYILRARGYRHIYIPYYSCDVILEPLRKLNITYDFYPIDEMLEPLSISGFNKNSAFLYTNYFGLKTAYVKKLARLIPNLIVDASQAFFALPLFGIDTFYSPRKFFGVPDGGYASCEIKLLDDFEEDHSADRFSHLITRIDKSANEGYADFKKNELDLSNQPIKKMSKLSNALLNSIDYHNCLKKRNQNFRYLHSHIKDYNGIGWIDDDMIDGPMVYPFYTNDNGVRKRFAANQIYVAKYWPNVNDWVKGDSIEYGLCEHLLALPIDQRYGETEMKKIIEVILG
jgi:hypothetical protein